MNKVSTKVELRFLVEASDLLSPEEKEKILEKLANRINDAGELVLTSQTERTQVGNKAKVTEKFYELIGKALRPVKKRRATRPTLASKEDRLDEKRQRSEKKERRRKPGSLPHS